MATKLWYKLRQKLSRSLNFDFFLQLHCGVEHGANFGLQQQRYFVHPIERFRTWSRGWRFLRIISSQKVTKGVHFYKTASQNRGFFHQNFTKKFCIDSRPGLSWTLCLDSFIHIKGSITILMSSKQPTPEHNVFHLNDFSDV